MEAQETGALTEGQGWTRMSNGWVQPLGLTLAALEGRSHFSPRLAPLTPLFSGAPGGHPVGEGLTLLGISQHLVVKKRSPAGTCEERISQFGCQGLPPPFAPSGVGTGG